MFIVKALPLINSISNSLPSFSGEIILDDRDDLGIGARTRQAKNAGYPLIIVVGKPALDALPKFELINNMRNKNNDNNVDKKLSGKKKKIEEGEMMTHLELLAALNDIDSKNR